MSGAKRVHGRDECCLWSNQNSPGLVIGLFDHDHVQEYEVIHEDFDQTLYQQQCTFLLLIPGSPCLSAQQPPRPSRRIDNSLALHAVNTQNQKNPKSQKCLVGVVVEAKQQRKEVQLQRECEHRGRVFDAGAQASSRKEEGKMERKKRREEEKRRKKRRLFKRLPISISFDSQVTLSE